jgi:hypothetical protein
MYKYLCIDTLHNNLVVSNDLVGIGELVEIYAPDEETPPQAGGKTLRKTKDPSTYVVHASYEGHDGIGRSYDLGERCTLKVVARNRSGIIRRKCSGDEKLIVNLEKNERHKEHRVVRAKTGSVRRRRS